MWIRIGTIFFIIFAQAGFFSKTEAGDEEYHLKILRALTQINHRLVSLEKDEIRSIKSVQESLLNQVMTIRTSIEQTQATGELNKSEMLASVGGVKTKILDIESHLKNEVMIELGKEKSENEKFRVEFLAEFDQLKKNLATDMKNLSKANDQYFNVFNEGNKEQLQQIVKVLEEQNKKLIQTQALFTTDLIPALDIQGEETRQALLSEFTQARAAQENFLELNYKQVVASLATMEEKNKTLIEIFKKSILIDEETKNLTETIQQNIGGANKNIDQTRKMIEILQEVLVQLNEDLVEIKNNQKTAKPQLKTLVNLSSQMNKQSSQMQQSIKKIPGANTAQLELSNEKLSRLIDILKTLAIEQGKMDKALQAFTAKQGKIDQVLKGQEKVEQVLQGQGLKSIVSQETILNTQKEITGALQDLRRKANVNISRSDDILNQIKRQK